MNLIVEARPEAALVDEPLAIVVRGAPARAPVLVRATTWDRDGRPWRASATFTADGEGKVDVARQAPVEGS